MKNTKTINEVTFEVKKVHVSSDSIHWSQFKNLVDCYDRPSEIKKAIYFEWFDYFEHLNASCHYSGITSYNCMMFTYSAVFTYEGVTYLGVITKSHNRLYIVD